MVRGEEKLTGRAWSAKTIHAASGRARAASIKQILVRTVWQSSSPGPSRAPRHVHGVAFRRGGARSQIPVRQRPLLGHSTSIIVPRFAPCAKLRASCSSHHSYFARLLRGVLPSESQIAFPWRASPFPAILRESGFAGSDARSTPATLVFPTPTFLDMAFACLGRQATVGGMYMDEIGKRCSASRRPTHCSAASIPNGLVRPWITDRQ